MITRSNYNVQILVDGKPVKEYTKDGKTFVEAKSGTEYSVRIKNNSGRRAVAVVSIDGINTITGEVATPDSTGYVVGAYSSIEVKGYRQDNEGGGRFKFTEKESGYSKEVDGTGINSGVIGVAFVAEKQEPASIRIGGTNIPDPEPFDESPWHPSKPYRPSRPWRDEWPWPRIWCGGATGSAGDPTYGAATTSRGTGSGQALGSGVLRSMNFMKSADPEPASLMSYCADVNDTQARSCSLTDEVPSFDRATTWGSKFTESMEYVSFKRSNDTETHNIYYASRDALKAMGIIKEQPPQVAFPQSFPKFAKPPTGWKS
jgi:hypothetical protein